MLKRAGEISFYLGLLLEVLIVILDKSSWINPVEGQLFRVSFLFFAVKLSLTEYTRRSGRPFWPPGSSPESAICVPPGTKPSASWCS